MPKSRLNQAINKLKNVLALSPGKKNCTIDTNYVGIEDESVDVLALSDTLLSDLNSKYIIVV